MYGVVQFCAQGASLANLKVDYQLPCNFSRYIFARLSGPYGNTFLYHDSHRVKFIPDKPGMLQAISILLIYLTPRYLEVLVSGEYSLVLSSANSADSILLASMLLNTKQNRGAYVEARSSTSISMCFLILLHDALLRSRSYSAPTTHYTCHWSLEAKLVA